MTELFPVLVLTAAFIADLTSTIELWGRYRRVGPTLAKRERLILQSYVVVAVVITITAGFFGILATQHLMGFDVIEGTAVVTWALSIAALFIPTYLRLTLRRVAAEPTEEP